MAYLLFVVFILDPTVLHLLLFYSGLYMKTLHT